MPRHTSGCRSTCLRTANPRNHPRLQSPRSPMANPRNHPRLQSPRSPTAWSTTRRHWTSTRRHWRPPSSSRHGNRRRRSSSRVLSRRRDSCGARPTTLSRSPPGRQRCNLRTRIRSPSRSGSKRPLYSARRRRRIRWRRWRRCSRRRQQRPPRLMVGRRLLPTIILFSRRSSSIPTFSCSCPC